MNSSSKIHLDRSGLAYNSEESVVSPSNALRFQNPGGYEIQSALLLDFERGLDPSNPQDSKFPCKVLGYGEISTVFEIQAEGLRDLAFKRICIFETLDELDRYIRTYQDYNHKLESDIGVRLPPHGYAVCDTGRPIFYIIQECLSPASIGNNALRHLSPQEIGLLFRLILRELYKVWGYNLRASDDQVGIDGQISNWSIEDFDIDHPSLSEHTTLVYIDTSAPFCRLQGVEQFEAELFLRSAPPYLTWILRLLFLKDVMNRYYEPRKVIIDLIANFYKEQRPELIPEMVRMANAFITGEAADLGLQEIRVKEVRDYYREDAIIWSLYLSMRRFDRFVRRKLLGREYPHILPGKIKR
jgi:hypothetical protein